MRDSTDNAELMLESYFAGYAGLSQSGFSPVGFFDVLGRRRDPGEGWDDSVHDFRAIGETVARLVPAAIAGSRRH